MPPPLTPINASRQPELPLPASCKGLGPCALARPNRPPPAPAAFLRLDERPRARRATRFTLRGYAADGHKPLRGMVTRKTSHVRWGWRPPSCRRGRDIAACHDSVRSRVSDGRRARMVKRDVLSAPMFYRPRCLVRKLMMPCAEGISPSRQPHARRVRPSPDPPIQGRQPRQGISLRWLVTAMSKSRVT